jgi:hypothetical protein
MSIADKILRSKTDYDEVYDAGYSKGKAEGGGGDSGSYEDGFEDGKKAEYDAFWDDFQNNKQQIKPRNQYNYAFYQVGWTDVTYRPKYDFNIQYALGMFSYSLISDTIKTLDFTTLLAAASNVFARCPYLKTIRKIVVNETTTFSGWFIEDTALENITVEGTIGQDFDIHWSTKLSAASIASIMGALSTTVSGMPTITLSLVAVDKAFETSEGANDGRYSDAWKELYYAHNDKWSISLL